MGRRGKRATAFAALAVALVFFASLANAELIERGNLFIKFAGGIAPTKLPRQENAPISVRVDGTVRTLSGERPPALRFISIAINRGGTIETRGLPVCRRSQIESASSAQALAACGDALVGSGRYVAGVTFPEQAPLPLRGRILGFNSVVDGQRAILAHIFGSTPFPNSRTFVFHIRRSRGTFGTVLTAALPKYQNESGYLRRIVLNLRRDYVYRGRKHSYLSASCGAPPGATIGIFPFVRVGMTFADGRKLASTLIRTCTVRK
ncbi:MAG TPA: hypothetical protein VFY75_10180 [Solirubrobacterales bacterium]|nr:hypothetical protein [Solirubrobacterales bacterium]